MTKERVCAFESGEGRGRADGSTGVVGLREARGKAKYGASKKGMEEEEEAEANKEDARY